VNLTAEALRYGPQLLPCKVAIPAFLLVNICQTAAPWLGVAIIWLQLTTHLSTPWGWKAELAETARRTCRATSTDLTVRLDYSCWLTYSGRFTHINGYPSAAGQSAGKGKAAGQRPTFFHWATPSNLLSTFLSPDFFSTCSLEAFYLCGRTTQTKCVYII